METLVLQELRSVNDNLGLGYRLHYWRTANGLEVDFILYGERGLHAVEVKRAHRVGRDDLRGLRTFRAEYPMAAAWLVYGGTKRTRDGDIEIVPLSQFPPALPDMLG